MTRVESPAKVVLLVGFVDRFVCHAQTTDAFRHQFYIDKVQQGRETLFSNERSSPSFVFDRVRRFMHNCSMETFHTTTIAANVHRTRGVLRKTVKLGLRWIGYIVLAALLVTVIGASWLDQSAESHSSIRLSVAQPQIRAVSHRQATSIVAGLSQQTPAQTIEFGRADYEA